MAHSTKRIADMTGLREQIKANLAALAMPQLDTANIVLSKPADGSEYTAWVFVGDGRPVIRGAARDAPEDALAELLEATAELVAERLVQRLEAFDENASGMGGEGLLVADGVRDVQSEASAGASATMSTGTTGRERSFTSSSGHEYRTTDGSCCGYGVEREVVYCAG